MSGEPHNQLDRLGAQREETEISFRCRTLLSSLFICVDNTCVRCVSPSRVRITSSVSMNTRKPCSLSESRFYLTVLTPTTRAAHGCNDIDSGAEFVVLRETGKSLNEKGDVVVPLLG